MKKAVQKLFGYASADPRIYLIATADGSTINGQIATDVIGMTFLKKWPRVIIFLGKDKYTAALIAKSRVFSIHLLSTRQLELVRTFGMFSGQNIHKFKNLHFDTGITGSPIISGTVGWADCKVIDSVDLGDHTAFVGLIVDGGVGNQESQPLRVSYFLKHAPKTWLLRLALTTRKSRKAVLGPMEAYARKKGLA